MITLLTYLVIFKAFEPSQIINGESFEGERPLFKSNKIQMKNVIIHPGESAIKESANIIATNCEFEGKYPFWHNSNTLIENCTFRDGARAAIWYGHDIAMINCKIEAPKMFREIESLAVENVSFPNAQETFWFCRNLSLMRVEIEKADYIFINNENLKIDSMDLKGNYAFQYCRNVVIINSVIYSKDAFWNTENVTVYNSTIIGEYLAWHSKRLTLVNCIISGTQPLCYCSDLVLVNCTFDEKCDLCFEYSTVKAEIRSPIKSVKNPTSGTIVAERFDEVIIDKNVRQPNNCKLITWSEKEKNKNQNQNDDL